ncbi:immunoglobulin lambda-like polypeptide 5 [Sarcophilus harrisii]
MGSHQLSLSTGPRFLLLLFALTPSAFCLSPEKERKDLPRKENSGLIGSQAGEPWDPQLGGSQQKASPELESKGLRFPDQPGLIRSKRTCRHPSFKSNSESQWLIFGKGTQLIVLEPDQPKMSPTVNVFALFQDEFKTQEATLVCLMSGFYPGVVEVAWTMDGSPMSQGVATSRPFRQTDNKYSSSSYLTLSAAQWMSASAFTCKVTHDGKVIQKELSPAQCT